MWNNENRHKPQTTSLGRSFLPQPRTATQREIKALQVQKRYENGKKRHKKQSSLYCLLRGKSRSHTTRECKFRKSRTKDRDKAKYSTKYYKRKSREVCLLEKEAALQRAKYLKYKKLNKTLEYLQGRDCHYN